MENNICDTPAPPCDVEPDMPRPGAVLAAARVARNMTVEDVSRMLKLSVAKVTAIEADDYSSLPSPVFARGFVRSYARLLRVDVEPLLPAKVAAPVNKADMRMLHQAPRIPLEPRRYGRMPAMAASVTFVLAGLVYYEFMLNVPSAPYQIAGTVPLSRFPPTAPAGNDTVPAHDASATPLLVPVGETPGSLAAAENLQLKKSADAASGANEKGLHFLFNGESWVEVRDGLGKVVFSKTNAPGSERIVQGDPPFNLVIGGASGVQLNYNGSPVNLATYVTEDVARLRLE